MTHTCTNPVCGITVDERELRLRRANHIRTLRGSLAIEGSTLSEEQITAIPGEKPVIAPRRKVLEEQNVVAAWA